VSLFCCSFIFFLRDVRDEREFLNEVNSLLVFTDQARSEECEDHTKRVVGKVGYHHYHEAVRDILDVRGHV
jgi:hypothetical protein